MSLLNIHSDLKELLEDAIKKKDYKRVFKILNEMVKNKKFNVKEEIEGIFFKDVKNIVKTKEDLENILLSTKVLFESKEELLEFFDMLLKYDFKENALNYLEEILPFINDLEIIDGFNTLLKK
jgi:hypothetical protein